MMLAQSLFVLLVTASSSLAATPAGFQPASQNSLIVTFNGKDATGGKQISKATSAAAPQLATTTPLNGTSFAVIMVDLDIPGGSTLLHWMQLGLTPSKTGGTAASGNSSTAATTMKLTIPNGNPAAAAAYIGPNPPARQPLSHRYTQILVDTSAASQANLNTLTQAAKTRQGFNANQVLTQASLVDKVVAGNFFNVTNGQ